MSHLFSKIRDDITEYRALCYAYDEEVQMKDNVEDCYGKHAEKLKERSREDKQRNN